MPKTYTVNITSFSFGFEINATISRRKFRGNDLFARGRASHKLIYSRSYINAIYDGGILKNFAFDGIAVVYFIVVVVVAAAAVFYARKVAYQH